MSHGFAREVTPALQEIVDRLYPGARLAKVSLFGVDEGVDGDVATAKGTGYGVPLRLDVVQADGAPRTLVFHTERSDAFGHDRRADRAADMLLAFDRFAQIPHHVQAVDVGAIGKRDGTLLSLSDAGEFYLITSYAPGHVYADDLRRVAKLGQAQAADLKTAATLATLLAEIHSEKYSGDANAALRYRRAIRDLLGSGEGIFGLCDAYAADVPSAPPSRLKSIESHCLDWRWKLKHRTTRLSRTHGDFHPFNILVDEEGGVSLLDASRGCRGDPADDVACLAINYLFFAVERPETWRRAFRALFQEFLGTYCRLAKDDELFEVCAPFFAWRGLVLANPVWYPALGPEARDRVLRFIERVLAAERFDPAFVDEVFQ